MFDTSEEGHQEILRTNDGMKSLSKTPMDFARRSLINISETDSDDEANALNVAIQPSEKTKQGRPVVTRQLFQQAKKQQLLTERYIFEMQYLLNLNICL